MNRSNFALFVALLIHLLLLLLFWFIGSITPEIPKKPPEEKKIRIALKDLPKPKPVAKSQQKPEQTLEAPPMPKGSQLTEVEKAPLVKLEPKAEPKKPKLNPKPKPKPKVKMPKPKPKPKPKEYKPKPKPKVMPKPKEKVKPVKKDKTYIPLMKEPKKEPLKKEKKKNPLSWMEEDKSSENEEAIKKDQQARGASLGTKNLKKLYGSEWGKLTPGQQKYMLDNQEIMRRITQEVLNRQARVSDINQLNVNKTNVIEFKLHPNGDMSDFKFLSKSGYYVLDDITKATISYAYSKYPRPSETILIRYNVFYNLAKY